MKLKFISTTLMLSFGICAFSQSVDRQLIGSSGSEFQNTTAGLSYSVGEVVTASFINSSLQLTQGFQQNEIADNVGIQNTIKQVVHLYPNPARNSLQIENLSNGHYQFSIFDLNGKELHSGDITGSASVDIAMLASATYVFRLFTQDGVEVSHSKFVKL